METLWHTVGEALMERAGWPVMVQYRPGDRVAAASPSIQLREGINKTRVAPELPPFRI